MSSFKTADTDSKAMRIKVMDGKGKKYRYTLLSETVLVELRDYYAKPRLKTYLFTGTGKARNYGEGTIQRIAELPLANAGLADKNYSVLTIRHSSATHLLNNYTNMVTNKTLLGNTNLSQTYSTCT